mmetsp:Transcript_34789/g.88123  ORF Transcript_34789/g.88123 Transcript_34789/m.88123 type:complete len:404 (+) Transcript_34789:377-1588(+)
MAQLGPHPCWPCRSMRVHTTPASSHLPSSIRRSVPAMPAHARLAVDEQAAGVLDDLLDALEERHRLAAVNQAVVVRERQVHHGARLNLAAHHHGALHDGVHAQDGALRRVDDGRGQHGAVHAAVADGKRAARHVVDADGAVARLLAHLNHRLLHLRKVELVGAAQHGHHQALGRGHRDGDVHVVAVHDLVAVNHCVDRGHLVQRVRGRLHKGAHEAQLHAVLLQEQVLVLVAHIDDGRHVHLVEGGQQGVRVLRALQPLRHALPQARHLHAPLRLGWGCAGHTPAACISCWRSGLGCCRCRGGGLGCSRCCLRRLSLGCCRLGRWCCGCSCCCRGPCCSVQRAHQLANLHHLLLLDVQGCDGACLLPSVLHIDGDLVGLDLCDDVIFPHKVPWLLENVCDCPL